MQSTITFSGEEPGSFYLWSPDILARRSDTFEGIAKELLDYLKQNHGIEYTVNFNDGVCNDTQRTVLVGIVDMHNTTAANYAAVRSARSELEEALKSLDKVVPRR